MLMYQSAIAAARTIADALNAHQTKNTLVLTQADLNGFAALRIALTQGELIKTRLQSTSRSIDAACGAPLVTSAGPHKHFGTRVVLPPLNLGAATASTVGAWVTTLAQMSAVSESVTSSSGALSDQAFMILVAGSIHNSQVFIPSMYPPKSLAATQTTQLGKLINDLETERAALLQTLAVDAKRKSCSPTTAVGKRVNDQVAAASTAVDAFEASLFNAGASSATSQFTSAATYQQMLSADLLSQSFGNINDYQVAVIRAGDSGGSNLTKQSLFQGSRQYYSGGAGAYYLLFNADSGALACAGYAYGYHGFIAAGDVGMNGLQVPNAGASPAPVGAMYHPDDKLPNVVNQRSSDCH
jgi:hypothetical protein